ncbi:MAG: hypothetical protein IT223_02590 [Crocinitomicaceae bacterium]|nr:hypothetical protein [Crocinitomicaceae bacterium]
MAEHKFISGQRPVILINPTHLNYQIERPVRFGKLNFIFLITTHPTFHHRD